MTVVKERGEGSMVSYVSGFGLSVALTLIAYLAVVRHMFSGGALVAFIVGCALVQFGVQMLLFLHLGNESRPRWKLLAFLFMVLVVAILVLGSLWIMANLNYHMSGQDMERYLQQQDGGI